MSKRRRDPGEVWVERRAGRRYWEICWYDPATRQVRRRSARSETHEAAKQALAEHILAHRQPKKALPEDVYLAVAFGPYLDYIAARPSAEAAKMAAAYILGRDTDPDRGLPAITGFFEGDTVGDVTFDKQIAFMRHLRGLGHSDRYISRTMDVLRAAIGRAYKRNVLRHPHFITSVHEIADKGTAEREIDRAMDLDEMAAWFRACKSKHLWMFAMLSLNTCGRPDAILELTRFQCSVKDRLIRLNPPGRRQTKKRRPTVPMTDIVLPIIQQAKGRLVTYQGRPVGSVKKAMAETVDRAGLDRRFTPYAFRYTMAKALRRASVPKWEVEGFLGHKGEGARSTDRYAAYDPAYLSKARAAVDRYFARLEGGLGEEGWRVSCQFLDKCGSRGLRRVA